MRAGAGRGRRIALRLLLALLSIVAADQLVLRLAMQDGLFLGRRIPPFGSPFFRPEQEAKLDRIAQVLATGVPPADSLRFDPQLGWGAPRNRRIASDRTFDEHGARTGPAPLAEERMPGLRRLVCLGDSFTFGAEVSDEQAWPYLLDAEREDLEVANLGQGGHGLDQSLLRWRRDGAPLEPDEVWLGWLPSAALRVISGYRPAQVHQALTIYPKPRFRLTGDGELVLLPNPASSLQEVHDLLSSPERFLEAMIERDHWVARCPDAWAPIGSRPSHHTALGRLELHLRERGDREVAPFLLDADSEVFQLSLALVLRIRSEVEETGARFRFLVYPGIADLHAVKSGSTRYWGRFLDQLEARGVDVFELTGCLLRAGGPERRELYMPQGHWSPEGNRLVATELLRLLGD